MKIDPKLKNRIRFNQLDEDVRNRLRRFYHFTSARAALQILQSGFIWGDGVNLCPHFSHSRNSGFEGAESQEVCLTFQFSGAAHLVAADTPPTEYAPHSLYVLLRAWPEMYGLKGMRIDHLRVSPGTASGLQCVGYTPSPEYLARCKNNLDATMVLSRLKRLGAIDRSIRVPADAKERDTVQQKYPPANFGTLDVWKMKWQLWRRRLQRRGVPQTA